MKRQAYVFIPNDSNWRYDKLSDGFIRHYMQRSRESYVQVEAMLDNLDERMKAIGQEAFREWADSRGPLRQKIETAMKEVQTERRRLTKLQDRLVQVMDLLEAERKRRRRDFDKTLPG